MPDHSPPDSVDLNVTRREFHRGTAALAMASAATPVIAGPSHARSEQVTLGVIGLGSRGFNLINDFLRLPDCRIVAVCDVDDFHHRDRPWGTGPAFGRRPAQQLISKFYAAEKSGTPQRGLQIYKDYRGLIARDDIDAIVVATPDHWHTPCTLAALQAGKDVYCEKPVTHLFAEGQAIVAEVAKRRAVFQTGSQQRSDPRFHRIVELAQNGVLGEIQSVEVGLPPGYAEPMGSTQVEEPRADLDYEMWCGPSARLPLMQARHHRWWRGHRAYGGGVLMDWIGHHNDIAHWAIGQHRSGPTKVEAVDWAYPETDVYNTPSQYTIRCEYPGGITTTISSQHTLGLKVIGSEGWVYAKRGASEASDKRWLAKNFQPGSKTIQAPPSHAADFLLRIRDRGECMAPAQVAHRSITPGHLGYVSAELKRPLVWNPETECVVDDVQADRLLKHVRYRAPWHAPESA